MVLSVHRQFGIRTRNGGAAASIDQNRTWPNSDQNPSNLGTESGCSASTSFPLRIASSENVTELRSRFRLLSSTIQLRDFVDQNTDVGGPGAVRASCRPTAPS